MKTKKKRSLTDFQNQLSDLKKGNILTGFVLSSIFQQHPQILKMMSLRKRKTSLCELWAERENIKIYKTVKNKEIKTKPLTNDKTNNGPKR